MARRTFTHLGSIAAGVLLLLAPATESLAAPITVPTALNPGDQYRLGFVTSTTRDATSANIADYNAFVTSAAVAVPELLALGTTWTAIGSTSTVDARDNTNTNPIVSVGVPIYLLNDTLLVNGNADLWDGVIGNLFRIREDGTPNTDTGVWTGTSDYGTGVNPLGLPSVSYGLTNYLAIGWVRFSSTSATSVPHHMYAVSDVLTVVPEPGTAALLAFGLAGLAGARRRRSRHGAGSVSGSAVLLPLVLLLFFPTKSTATLIGDSVQGCFSSSACSAGSPGVFTSGTAVVSQSTVEFSGTAGGFSITADLLTYNGADTIRLSLTGPGSASLPAGYSIGFYDLDWVGPLEFITAANTDTTFLFSQIDQTYNVADCEGDLTCEQIVSQNNALAKATSILPVTSILTTPDSVLINLGAVTAGSFGGSFSDVTLTTQVVPEAGTALLLSLGLAGLALRRRRSAGRRKNGGGYVR